MTRAARIAGLAIAIAAGTGAAATAVRAARAQSVDVRRPAVFVVGVPPLGARAVRVDGARTGLARTTLPTKQVHTAWRASAGVAVEQAPLVDEDGMVYVLGSRGEVVALGPDGEERWRSTTGAAQPGPGALLSDRTLVFVDGAGQAVAVRDGIVQWRTRFGQRSTPCPSPTCPAPLPLDDGGVVVATAHELAVLDSSGQPRARIPLPEPSTAPLLSALGQVVVLSTAGTLWTWSPGAPDLVRAGAFGAPVDGGVALADDHTVLGAASGQAHLAAVDLLHGTTTLRAAAAGGAWLGPPAMRGSTAYLVLLTSTAETAVAVDASGAEVGRALLAVHAPLLVDAGASPAAPPHTGPLVDIAGTMAFSTTEGSVGVVAGLGSASPTVELVADACPTSSTSAHPLPPIAGLAPLPPAQFVAVCTSGAVLAVSSGPAGRRAGPR
jgi:hypothetical protein